MIRSLTEGLALAAPVPSRREGEETIDDLDRIFALPRRLPLNCQRDPETRRYVPETEVLVLEQTARFGRGKRISCACRPRVVRKVETNLLLVSRVLPEDVPPEPPLFVPVSAFVADHGTSAREIADARTISLLRVGEEVALSAADGIAGHFCISELNAVQAWTLKEISEVGGGAGFASVGTGKSWIFLLAPFAFPEARLAVLLIEPNQRQHYRSQYLRLREHFRVTSIVFDDAPGYPVSGSTPLHLVPYSRLGHPSTPDLLDRLNPDLILADEAHRLTGDGNLSAGRRRIRRYILKKIVEREERQARGERVASRAVFFLAMSGTLEDKSVKDTQPLLAHALGTGSPLPLDPSEADRWSQVMDPGPRPDRESGTAKRLQRVFGSGVWNEANALENLLLTGPEEAIRRGVQLRRAETKGVITASSGMIGSSLYFRERKAPKMPPAVLEALKRVREEGIRPDGEVIVGDSVLNVRAMQIQTAKEIACGFFYFWSFPQIPCTCRHRLPKTPRFLRTEEEEEPGDFCEGCLLIKMWYERRKLYGKELRARLLRSEIHLDSPKLCMNAAIRAEEDSSRPPGKETYCIECRESWPCGRLSHLPAWVSHTWGAWREVKDKVPHEQRVHWIDDFFAKDAADWALTNRGVLWYLSTALGKKISELSGLPYYGGGPNSEAAIRAVDGKTSILVSLWAHGKGLDGLQNHYWKQLWLEMPSSSRIVEQGLGRLHRPGQRKEMVETDYYVHVVESREALRKVLERSEFNEQMTGNKSLILSADFEDEV